MIEFLSTMPRETATALIALLTFAGLTVRRSFRYAELRLILLDTRPADRPAIIAAWKRGKPPPAAPSDPPRPKVLPVSAGQGDLSVVPVKGSGDTADLAAA